MQPYFHLSVKDLTPRAAELGVGTAVLGRRTSLNFFTLALVLILHCEVFDTR
jgi:hypothetical protein